MPADTISERSPRIPPGRLWFGAVGAAVAWALQGFTCFLLSTQACANGTGHWGPLSGAGVRILLGCVAAAYLAAGVASGWVSYRNWRQLADSRPLLAAEGYGREEYMALAGVIVGVTAGVGLVWAAMAPIFENVCTTYW
jgi:hypothetical protein